MNEIEQFKEFKQTEKVILIFSKNANVRNKDNFAWETFFNDSFLHFLSQFIEKIKEVSSQHQLLGNFSILDHKELPKSLDALENYEPELEELISHYGADKGDDLIATRTWSRIKTKKKLTFNSQVLGKWFFQKSSNIYRSIKKEIADLIMSRPDLHKITARMGCGCVVAKLLRSLVEW